jgi:hypothetical protein
LLKDSPISAKGRKARITTSSLSKLDEPHCSCDPVNGYSHPSLERKGWESNADLPSKAVPEGQLQKAIGGEMVMESRLGA